MPQISQLAETFSSQIVWLLVFFAITYFIVGRGMVPRVMDTMDRRSKQIADDISAAHAAREQADKEEEAWRVRENENRARAQALIAEAKAEAAMSRDGTTLDSDVLKVAHHGSKTSTTDDFLERVDPEIVVISVGSRNSYGHPDPGVLARLREMVGQANIYRTDKHGSIEVVSDGANIWVKTGGG